MQVTKQLLIDIATKGVKSNIIVKCDVIGSYRASSESELGRFYDVACGRSPSGVSYCDCKCIAGTYGRRCKHADKVILYHMFLVYMQKNFPKDFENIVNNLDGQWSNVQKLMNQVISQICKNM